ncbi:hypothetical protein RIF29_18254 [Crotalaria pallida]|uniref:Uncharacterized protein n=1 Tax=Crotalaria pallida TaxID=3830 RepID=A0AAN9IG19_CROPI
MIAEPRFMPPDSLFLSFGLAWQSRNHCLANIVFNRSFKDFNIHEHLGQEGSWDSDANVDGASKRSPAMAACGELIRSDGRQWLWPRGFTPQFRRCGTLC